ncbi:hypothetical protein D3C85_734290 [compost metagenome]
MHIIDHHHQLRAVSSHRLKQDDDPVFERQLATTFPEQQSSFSCKRAVDLGNAGQQAVSQSRRLIILASQ